ncbi:MAG: DUF4352 domain-containing protein [Clostridia bacterium]|nr:DUF4352 domain-containing protein [Clostridia bacterium]
MEEKKKSGFATAGLVLGIIAICFSFIPLVSYVSFVLGALAIIFSIVALVKKASKGMAIAGLIVAVIAVFMAYNMHKGLEKVVDEVSNALDNNKAETLEYNQGDAATLGDAVIKVTKVEKSQGNDWNKPKSGKEFVIITVSIENKGSGKLSYNPYDFKLQNSQGQQESMTFTTIDNDTALSSGELVAGGKVSGTIAFETTKGDKGLSLIYSDSILSSKELKIKLK